MENVRLELINRDAFASNPIFRSIMAECVYQPTDEKMNHVLSTRYGHNGTALFALYAGDQCIAVAGTRRTGDRLAELMHIAVSANRRGEGFGGTLVARLIQEQSLRELVAETDADAVGFYRNCGFSIESLGEKYPGTERFLCKRIMD